LSGVILLLLGLGADKPENTLSSLRLIVSYVVYGHSALSVVANTGNTKIAFERPTYVY